MDVHFFFAQKTKSAWIHGSNLGQCESQLESEKLKNKIKRTFWFCRSNLEVSWMSIFFAQKTKSARIHGSNLGQIKILGG